MKDLRQTIHYANYMKLLGWDVEEVSDTYIFIRDLKLFQVIKLQRPERFVSEKKLFNLVRHKSGSLLFYIEPKDQEQADKFRDADFKPISSSSLPSKTIRFDLSRSDDQLLGNMHHKTRYNIGLSKRRGLKLVEEDDIKRFSNFWHKCAKKRPMNFSLEKEIISINKAFKDNSQILWAKINTKPVACILILYTKQAGYYMYAASTPDGNKNQAPSFLVWEAIQQSKRSEKSYFDLEGIYDTRFPIRSWKGFSRFKKSFGGEEVEFPGSMRKIYWPLISK